MSDVKRALGRDLGTALALAFQAVRLYPAQHPERARRQQRWLELWNDSAQHQGVVAFDFSTRRLHLGETTLHLDSPAYHDLIDTATDLSYHRMELSGPEGGREALRIMEQLAGGKRPELPSDVPASAALSSAAVTPSVPIPTSTPRTSATVDPSPAPASSAASSPRADFGLTAPKALSAAQEPIELLRRIWSGVAEQRRFDRDMCSYLVRLISRLPGDGLVEPVMLQDSGDPALLIYEQALNTARLVYVAARAMTPGAKETERLVEAALLADIGMLSVPATLTMHAGRLRPDEYRIVRQHPAIGSRWLLATPNTSDLAVAVSYEHHMRSDGQGYPATAAPWHVMAASQLFQVADVYSALRTQRPFRPPLAEAEARALLRRLAESWLDSTSVELMLEAAAPAGCSSEKAPALLS